MADNEGMVIPMVSYRNFQSTPVYTSKALIGIVDDKLKTFGEGREGDVSRRGVAIQEAKAARDQLERMIQQIETSALSRQLPKEKIRDGLDDAYKRLLSASVHLQLGG